MKTVAEGDGTAQIPSKGPDRLRGIATTGEIWNSVWRLDHAICIALVRFITKILGAGTGADIAVCSCVSAAGQAGIPTVTGNPAIFVAGRAYA
jgi:hypothetical protein